MDITRTQHVNAGALATSCTDGGAPAMATQLRQAFCHPLHLSLSLSLSLLQHRLERGTDAPPPARVRALVVSGPVLLLHDEAAGCTTLIPTLQPS